MASMLLVTFITRAGNGGGQVKAIAVLDGSKNQIKVDSFRTVQDSAFFNPANSGVLDTSYTVQNQISLMINEASTLYLRSKFSVTVVLRISYRTGTGANDTASALRTFRVGYDSAQGGGADSNSRSTIVFNGAHQVTIKVVSVTSTANGWDPTSVLLIENQLTANVRFLPQCNLLVSNITVSPSDSLNADELPVSWSAVQGADQYDLEWTYIDTSALKTNKYRNADGSLNPQLIFRNNATRVSITGSSYNIPLMYDDSGTIFIRVRPVQIRAGYNVIAAPWSSDGASPVMGQYSFWGHERPLNWQSNISFAEEGKRKVVAQYFDGSLRSRQTVTKDNTTNTTIVGETYYDYQGRPTIQVMPSPTLKTIIQYTAGFNTGINGIAYSQSNYDSLPYASSVCDIHADSMSNGTGASLYYSPHNPVAGNGLNQFIPDAQDYPFSETEYTADNTGRISRQGGVGKDFQLGSNHEAKYYYGTPTQRELDGLFGIEVGNFNHYFKNMVRDANGQYSVSYVDMHGRTIATALSGIPPAGMSALPSWSSNKVTDQLVDPKSAFFQGQSMVSQKSLLVSMADTFNFKYSLTPPILSEPNCQGTTICYTCKYDLEVTITDDCHNQRLGRGGQPYDTVIHNIQIDSTNSCTPTLRTVNFSLVLPEGSYLITKRLTPTADGFSNYRDSIYLKNNTCVSISQFINQQKAINASYYPNCTPSCQACQDSVGTWNQFWSNYMTNGGIPPADTASYRQEAWTAYQNALSGCDALCNNQATDDNAILNAMLQDLTPPFGQYADTSNRDRYSIFYIRPNDTLSYVPIFKLPAVHYQNATGDPDSVYIPESGLMVDPNSLTADQFVQNFQPSWANALLPYHPEYCRLQALQQRQASEQWDRQFEAVDTYSAAVAAGYLNPTGSSSVPFPAGSDPLYVNENGTVKSALTAGLMNYQPIQGATLSMWSLAWAMVKCNSSDNACFLSYYGFSNIYPPPASWCNGDLDMAWRNFREMYLGLKQKVMNQYILANPAGCVPVNSREFPQTPTNAAILSAHHTSEFSDVNTAMSYTALNNSNSQHINSMTMANNAYNAGVAQMDSMYRSNCYAYVTRWYSILTQCKVYDTTDVKNTLIPALDSLCVKAADADHPFGASSMPPGQNYTFLGTTCNNFEAIIQAYNQSKGIIDTLNCNPEMITSPAPYDNQPVYTAKPVYSRPSDCECSQISNLYTGYTAGKQNNETFSAYLQRTEQITMAENDLDQLLAMCGNTTGTCINLSQPIYLPAAMQCHTGSTCVPCHVVDSLYTSYKAIYPSFLPVISSDTDTVLVQKNTLFQNYMNNKLGFNLMAYQYLQFMDSCTRSDTSGSIGCQPHAFAYLFNSTGTDAMTDMKATSDGGLIWAGNKTTITGNGVDAYLVKYSSAGVVQWAKAYGGAMDDGFNKVISTSDGGYLAVGYTYSDPNEKEAVFAVKVSSSGGLQWQRTIGFSSSVGDFGFDVAQTNDGGYAIVGDHNYYQPSPSTSANMLVIKLNSDGSTSWAKSLGPRYGTDGYGVLASNNMIVLGGRSYDGSSKFVGTIYRLNHLDGTIIDNAFYQMNGATGDSSFAVVSIFPSATGYRIRASTNLRASAANGRMVLMDLNSDLSVSALTQIGLPPSNNNSSYYSSGYLLPTNDGGYLVGQSSSGTNNIYWLKMSSANTQQWAMQTNLPGSQTLAATIQNGDGSYTSLGTNGGVAMLLNTSATGTTNCYDVNTSIQTFNRTLSTPAMGGTFYDNFISQVADVQLSATDYVLAKNPLDCTQLTPCFYNGPVLCGKTPLFAPVAVDSTSPCSDSLFFSVSKGTELYITYRDSLTGDFEHQYNAVCLNAYKTESFTVTHKDQEYHYTLYYYDQAGNLVKTVPPAGVQKMTDSTWMASVDTARVHGAAWSSSLVPAHTLVTNYRYNTLNQVVSQRTPDAGGSNFWYDRLGRLAVSQNARQNPNNQYSYTQYDTIGRIVQVGQLVSSTAITDNTSRVDASLAAWLNNAASTADQITVTGYDTAYTAMSLELTPRNLRNRVSWTGLFNKAADLANGNPNAANATYYSYDILGNADTLVHDFGSKDPAFASVNNSMNLTGNRYKKVVYDFDLVSGKVNNVFYQAGQRDGFYHAYQYDAENRITNVLTSKDSINWDNDAFYSYYAHGPVARTVLGQQQVQGINYAYTLQGWLKAINPAPYTGTGFNLQPDSAGNNVAANAYGLVLNYFDGDFKPISGAPGPDNGTAAALGGSYRPLYNGNISSMGVNVRTLNPLLYNYQYDQLNRLVQMDAWKKPGADWSVLTPTTDYHEAISYDPNGNIQKYLRNGYAASPSGQLGMDSLNYAYLPGTNKLDHIKDSVNAGNYPDDLETQAVGNYQYDSIGNLIGDAGSNISKIYWTVYGKIDSIVKADGTTIKYAYNSAGQRVSKTVHASGNDITTWYVRDGQGNVLSVYTFGDPSVKGKDLTQTELHIYGSSRLGMLRTTVDMENQPIPGIDTMHLVGNVDSLTFNRGNKLFELSNHLGNVLATISDRRFGQSADDSTVRYYLPDIVSANDYYPFGSLQPGRNYSASGGYRYGFNGQEHSEEVNGAGNSYTAEFWEYDPRIGRRWNVDPKPNVGVSEYSAFNGNPIWYSDPIGDTSILGHWYEKAASFFKGRIDNFKRNSANEVGWVKDHLSTMAANSRRNTPIQWAMLKGMFNDFLENPMDYIEGEGVFKEMEYLGILERNEKMTYKEYVNLLRQNERTLIKREILEANKIAGKTAEKAVTGYMEAVKSSDEMIFNQVRGSFADGTETIYDNVVYNRTTNTITLTNETKSGGASMSEQQLRAFHGEKVTFGGSAPVELRGKTISSSTTPFQLSRLDLSTGELIQIYSR